MVGAVVQTLEDDKTLNEVNNKNHSIGNVPENHRTGNELTQVNVLRCHQKRQAKIRIYEQN